jgi:OOP family OmpA-OmpF porin
VACYPLKWLWGLPPIVLIAVLSIYGLRPHIERDLSERTAAALEKSEFYWALTVFEGRDAYLDGISFSRNERDTALDLIRNMWGVQSVTDRTNLIASPETYSWSATKRDKRIKIRGYVPTQNDRTTILGFIKATMPDLEVDDKMALAGGSPPRKAWLGFVSYALVQVSQLESGSVNLSGTKLSVNGTAATNETFQNLKSSLASQLPPGIEANEINIAPPVAQPYEWRVKYTGDSISFDGHVPSKEVHNQILERTRHLFPHVTISGDSMELASGAPESWSWAISASLTQLHRLESGRVKVKDTVVEFEGVAPDKFTAKNVAASVQHGLPAIYRSSEKVTVSEKAGTDEKKN